MKPCECENPNPPKNAQGKVQGNVCKECGGKILTTAEKARELGTLHVRLDRALANLPVEGEELGEFIAHMVGAIDENVKHKFQIWSHNRRVAKRKQT